MWDGKERRAHICMQEEKIGKFEEFMSNTKGLKATLFTIAVAIILQVGSFLYLWGGLTTTVTVHDKAIDNLVKKFDNVKIVYAETAEHKK